MNCKIRFLLFLFIYSLPVCHISAENEIEIILGGPELTYLYTAELLTKALEIEGYKAKFTYLGIIPTTRLEYMMSNGDISCYSLGATDSRSEKFLTIDINMTNNLMGHRILFIRPGTQDEYDSVYSLEDFRNLHKIVGMGAAWGDVNIWKKNDLSVEAVVGDWTKLYQMVASGQRYIDYLSRGAHEMLQEYILHPELAIEENLVLIYPRDHVLYVSPEYPELYRILSSVLPKVEESGLIDQLVRKYYSGVYEPPVNLDKRRKIYLELPD
ncbi:MAG: hypothetical protein PF518_09205 [Spirochaetaceae bacterium]|jgi:hypothetical protein|nr:hypothetical protein [Spirochaetaceae bacterium]